MHTRFHKVEHKHTRPFIFEEIVLANETKPAVKQSEVSAFSPALLFSSGNAAVQRQYRDRSVISVAKLQLLNVNTCAQDAVGDYLEKKVLELIERAKEEYGDRPPAIQKPLV